MNRLIKKLFILISISILLLCVSCSSSEVHSKMQNDEVKHGSNINDPAKIAQNDSNKMKQKTAVQDAAIIQKEKDAQKKAEWEKQLEDQYQLGYNTFFKKNYADAIKIESDVIQQDPSFYKAYNVKGIAQCYAGDFNGGMANINKSLQLKPNYGYALFNKALAYELYRHFDEAITWYKKDLAVENYVWTYYGIASIYGRRGDVANTVKYLKLAISFGAYTKTAAKTEKDFDNVRNSKEFQSLVYN
ncbi:hypothetical protein HPT25_16350 [Bacillus sp. BRMEA1]|uniref:tetratricopeptide repeat protein n=1 Tax=Neobacillus endophyticus TaxID=2738405 RepID=UPI00156497BE|nr:hypothetical protein [Neobacillus endophyticus]NRD78936.1 hypothetical protein [Neobacillus endophyticus]